MKKNKVTILFILLFISSLFVTFIFTQNQSDNLEKNQLQFRKEKANLVLDKLSKKEAGIYYFGFPECPWCQELQPMLEELLEFSQKEAYYIDIHDENFTKSDRAKLEKFYEESTGEKGLAVPFLVAINSFKDVETNVGTVEGHDASQEKMTENQDEKLLQKISDMIVFAEG
ncbi:MAG: transporter [Lactovum sp.]